METQRQFLTIIRRVGLPLLALGVIFHIGEIFLTQLMEQEISAPQGTRPIIWLYGFLSLFLSLLGPLLYTVLILLALQDGPWLKGIGKKMEQLLIEQLRATGKIVLWGLFFIVPGIFKYIQYIFVPFVVLLDSGYQQGERDALEASARRVKRRFFSVLGVVVVFTMVVPLVLSSFDEVHVIWKHPIPSLLLTGAEVVLVVLMILILLRLWNQTQE